VKGAPQSKVPFQQLLVIVRNEAPVEKCATARLGCLVLQREIPDEPADHQQRHASVAWLVIGQCIAIVPCKTERITEIG